MIGQVSGEEKPPMPAEQTARYLLLPVILSLQVSGNVSVTVSAIIVIECQAQVTLQQRCD